MMLAEIVLPGGITFLLGLSACFVAGLLYLDLINGTIQAFTTWFLGSTIMLFALRSTVTQFLPASVEKGNTDEDLDAYDKIIDVVETIPTDGEGRVSFQGSSWRARHHNSSIPCMKGTKVRILFRENLVWVVQRLENQNAVYTIPETHKNNGQP